MIRRWLRLPWRDDERGQSLVEMAMILPLLIALVVGIMDVARAVWVQSTLATAAREGTRYAIVHGAESDAPTGPGSATFTAPDQDSAVAKVVLERAVGLSGVVVAAQWPDGNAGRGSRVTVEASIVFTPALSDALLNGALRLTLRGSSTLVIHR